MSQSYKNRSSFYWRANFSKFKPYNAPANLDKPKLGKYAARLPKDEVKDLRERDNLDLLESLRHPREHDYYQDHTYYDQWELRDPGKENSKMLTQRYPFFHPNYQYTPWIWYPGDVVEVIEGPQTGQRGAIIAVVPYKNEIIVQNINVKDLTVPASESRPEQVVQREHPFNAKKVKHVDPKTNDLCDLKIVTVRKKVSDGEEEPQQDAPTEQKRISLVSGAILPIPSTQDNSGVQTGDPLRDTPYQDAMELTYNREQEMELLVDRKLRAIEEGFVQRLKASYEYHRKFSSINSNQMLSYQQDVQRAALDQITSDLDKRAEQLDDWWFEELAPHIGSIRERAQRTRSTAAAAATGRRPTAASGGDVELGDEEEEDALEAAQLREAEDGDSEADAPHQR